MSISSSGILALTEVFPGAKVVYNSQTTSGGANSQLSGSGVFIPFADLDTYTISSTGDFREFLFSVMDKANTYTNGLSETLTNFSSNADITGFNGSQFTKNFITSFVLDIGAQVIDVAEEDLTPTTTTTTTVAPTTTTTTTAAP